MYFFSSKPLALNMQAMVDPRHTWTIPGLDAGLSVELFFSFKLLLILFWPGKELCDVLWPDSSSFSSFRRKRLQQRKFERRLALKRKKTNLLFKKV